MTYFYTYDSPIGRITVYSDENAVSAISTQNPKKSAEQRETPVIKETGRQLAEYFSGIRKSFDLPLAPSGTTFQQKVWRALTEIPYGQTRTYKQIAEAIGNPAASRAVGMANNRNPLMIVVPCHRVIGASGKLVGYAGGLGMKETLLALEAENK